MFPLQRFLLLAMVLLLTFFQARTQQALYKTENGFIKFVSDAPLEFITAESSSLQGLVDIDKRTFAFQLEVNTLKGFNSPLQQEHFYENYMETEQYPFARFSGKIIETVDPEYPGEQTVRAKGLLDIHGVKQERIIKCTLKIAGDTIVVSSRFIVPLADHNITIPQLVYQKIAEEIQVDIKAGLTKE